MLPHRLSLGVGILSTLPKGIPQCCAAEASCLVTAWYAYSSGGYHQRVPVCLLLSVDKHCGC